MVHPFTWQPLFVLRGGGEILLEAAQFSRVVILSDARPEIENREMDGRGVEGSMYCLVVRLCPVAANNLRLKCIDRSTARQ